MLGGFFEALIDRKLTFLEWIASYFTPIEPYDQPDNFLSLKNRSDTFDVRLVLDRPKFLSSTIGLSFNMKEFVRYCLQDLLKYFA